MLNYNMHTTEIHILYIHMYSFKNHVRTAEQHNVTVYKTSLCKWQHLLLAYFKLVIKQPALSQVDEFVHLGVTICSHKSADQDTARIVIAAGVARNFSNIVCQ